MLTPFLGDLTQGIYYILTFLGLIIFVLIYLLWTSEFFNLRKFIISVALLSLMTFSSISLLFVLQRKPPEKLRVAILPFSNTTSDEKTDWLAWAITDNIVKALDLEHSNEYFYYQPEDIREILNQDSLMHPGYQERISRKLQLDFFIAGQIGISEQSFLCEYRIQSSDSGTLFSERINFDNIEKLPLLGLKIAQKFQNRIFKKNAIQTSNLPKFRTSSLISYYSAQKALSENSTHKAKSLINQAIEEDSTNISLWLLLTKTKMQEGAFDKKNGKPYKTAYDLAWKCLKTAHRLDSSLTQISQLRAQYFIYTEKWADAEKELVTLFRNNRYNPAIFLFFAQLHPSRFPLIGFNNEIELLKHALFINPGYLPAALALADYYTDSLQDRHQAIATLNQILEINPNQIQALMRLGQLYISGGNRFEVMEIFRRILEKEPNNSNVYYNLGIYYYNQKDMENALSLFERAIKIDNHLDAHLYAAYIYEQKCIAAPDSIQRDALLNQAIEHLRYRIRNKRGHDDVYAKTAREHLYRIFHN